MRRILLIAVLVVSVVVGLVLLGRGKTPVASGAPAAGAPPATTDCEEKPPPDPFAEAGCSADEAAAKPGGATAGS